MMDRERFEYLHTHPEAKLTLEELAEGMFFCCTWDGMLIHKASPEAQSCTCISEPSTFEDRIRKDAQCVLYQE